MNLLRKGNFTQGQKVTCKRAKAISKKLKWPLTQYINKLYPKLKANRIIHTFFLLSPLLVFFTVGCAHNLREFDFVIENNVKNICLYVKYTLHLLCVRVLEENV